MAGKTRKDAEGRPYVAPVIRDPEVRFGEYRILQRTDGPWVMVDERAPPGYRTVCHADGKPIIFKTQDAAAAGARKLYEAERDAGG